MTRSLKLTALGVVTLLALGACTTNPYTGEEEVSNTAKGSILGGLLGAGVGAVIGETTGARSRTAILVGAGIGALAGAGIGNYMDKEEDELRRKLYRSGVSVTRDGDAIVLNMPGNVTFDFNRAEIKPQFFEVLSSVVLVLNKYNRTLIDVDGHTDNIGTARANIELSERRARAVADYLVAQRVDDRRIEVHAFGKARPIADNATSEGRARNRRVEIRLVPLRQG